MIREKARRSKTGGLFVSGHSLFLQIAGSERATSLYDANNTADQYMTQVISCVGDISLLRSPNTT